MRISSVAAAAYSLPFRTPIRTAQARVAVRRGFLVRVRAGELEGLGDAAPWPGFGLEAPETCEAVLRRACLELPGLAADDGEGVHAWLEARAGSAPAAAGALRTALEDLAARRRGLSLATHLAGGAAAEEVAVAALLGRGTPVALAGEVRARYREGFRAFKVKLLGDPDLDRLRLGALAGAAPGPIAVRIDAGRGFRPAALGPALADLARFGPEFVEEPLADPAPRTLARLLRDTPVPLGFDESLGDPALRGVVLDHGAGHVAVIKPAALGGPCRALAVAREARARGLRVVVTSFLDSAVGVAAALHVAAAVGPGGPAAGLATSALLARDVAAPPRIGRGRAVVPARPGLGIELPPARGAGPVPVAAGAVGRAEGSA